MDTIKYAFSSNFQLATDFPIRYMASLSPLLRLATQVISVNNLREAVQGVVADIDSRADVVESLKADAAAMRQVDIKNDDEMVIFKCFVGWDEGEKWYIVFVEGGNENHWEKIWMQ